MANYKKRTERKRIAAMIIAILLVAVLLFGTIAPFFVRASVTNGLPASTSMQIDV